jgi:hypothetical protein
MAPVKLRLDAGLGPSPITIYAALCGAPESGKTESMKVSVDLLPHTIDNPPGPFSDEEPLGSGEGIVEAFYGMKNVDDGSGKAKKVRAKVMDHAFFMEDEGQKLGKSMVRPGSLVAETIRSTWSGSTAGQRNGRAETTRKIHRDTYSIGMAIGFQPSTIADLLKREEALAGTPQRFLYLSATDPSVPRKREDSPDWPGELVIDWPETLHSPSLCAMKSGKPIPRQRPGRGKPPCIPSTCT